jgi:hypothetical protein
MMLILRYSADGWHMYLELEMALFFVGGGEGGQNPSDRNSAVITSPRMPVEPIARTCTSRETFGMKPTPEGSRRACRMCSSGSAQHSAQVPAMMIGDPEMEVVTRSRRTARDRSLREATHDEDQSKEIREND